MLEYIKKYHYRPNAVAKGLANSKTYNIGWVIPGDSSVTDLPFFQRCMIGVSEVAAAEDYDILISIVFDHDLSRMKRIVKNRKVDGIILGRTLVEDCLRNQAECIMCMDDRICHSVLNKLSREGISIPEKVRVAEFIKGMDISTLLEEEACGARYFDGGKEGDLLEILKNYGANYVRLRLWNDPYGQAGFRGDT